MAGAFWKTDVITVPASTGTVAYTPWAGGEAPGALFCFGTNWESEDTVETTQGLGVFRGMAAPKWDDPTTLVEGVAFASPAGLQSITVETEFILTFTLASGGGTNFFRADCLSLDPDGYTLDWQQVAASGTYKVVILGLFGVANVAAFSGVTDQAALNAGFKAGASLLHGALGGPSVGSPNSVSEFWAGGAYPGNTSGNWSSAGITSFTFPTLSNQYNIRLDTTDPTVRICQGGHFIGPFLAVSNIRGFPDPSSLNDFVFDGDNTNGGMVVWWEDEDTEAAAVGSIPPNDGNTLTVPLPFAPGLLLGYSLSDEPPGGGVGQRGAIGFSVVTSDGLTWSAIIDGSTYGGYQSFQQGFVDRVNTTSVHGGQIALLGNAFEMTTDIDDITAGSFTWHAFGHPAGAAWIPHIYRRGA